MSADFEDLGTDLEQSRNADRRALEMLRRSARQMKAADAGRAAVFRLASRLAELQAYALTVKDEWAVEDAVRYNALTLQFGNLLSTYPEIQAFIEALPKVARTPEEIAALQAIEEDVAATLSQDYAKPIIDDSLPRAMREAAKDILDDVRKNEESFETARQSAAFENALRGLNATLSQLLEGETATRVKKSVRKEWLKHADKAGPYLTKLLVYLWKLTPSAGVGMTTGMVAQSVASQWALLAHISPEFGLLTGMLSLFAAHHVGKSKS